MEHARSVQYHPILVWSAVCLFVNYIVRGLCCLVLHVFLLKLHSPTVTWRTRTRPVCACVCGSANIASVHFEEKKSTDDNQ